ncbi:hypothetical protein pb186bvf_016297 [Paramecium bursaria]
MRKKKFQNISPAASQLIAAYTQCRSVSPKFSKTALYMPQSPIEEQIDEENELETSRLKEINQIDIDLKEISELRKVVDNLRQKYTLKLPSKQNKENVPKTHRSVTITSYQHDFLRQQYGKIK